MHRPLSRRQQRENRAFLKALRATGNARLAALVLGVNRSTYTKRRAKHPAFAAAWEAALEQAHARFQSGGEARHQQDPPLPLQGRGTGCKPVEGPLSGGDCQSPMKTVGGEPVIIRTASGRLQIRRSPPGRMTKAAEQAFFRALSASANVRLSAAAAGFAHSSFYAKRRGSLAFEREMKVALDIAVACLEWAAIESAQRGLGLAEPGYEWEEGALETPIPPMTPDQVLQFLRYRLKARQSGRAGGHAPADMNFEQVAQVISRNVDAVERRRRYDQTGSWRLPEEG